jgi:asparagine synthase (glutamine-hydrolysing)
VCGICGAVQVGGRPRAVLTEDTLIRMTDVMTHRGPDERGLYAAPGVAFGARRLSIVDVANGHQPAASEDGRIRAVQNGEIYNNLELRRLLSGHGHILRSSCDTEVLPHLYEDAGDEFVNRLRGMFAVAIWDEGRQRAVLARDRLGIKPLYYAVCDDIVVFGSELKSVLASGLVGPRLDYDAVEAYLTLGFVPGPRTVLAGVQKVLPGERLVVESGSVVVERYWSYPIPTPEPASPGEWRERLLVALDESVALHLMSDVPLGAMLSGGLDSSLIVGLMARRTSSPVETFSVGFAGATNELSDARLVSSAFGTNHHELELPLDHEVDLSELVWHLDEPLADLSSLGFYALSQLAREHVTVALSGQGADELLGGYSRHRAATLMRRWNTLPRPVRSLTKVVARGSRRVQRLAELAELDPVDRFVATRELAADLPDAWRQPRSSAGTAASRAVAERFPSPIQDPLDAILYLDANLGLADDMLHYFDRMSMSFSLEVRVPFLDHELVQLCAAIPRSFKVHRGTMKWLLKEAARGIVPDAIIDKPKIGFFNTAVETWVKGALAGPAADHLLDRDPAYADFLDRSWVEDLVHRQMDGSAPSRNAHLLLAILVLEVWLSSYLPRALADTAPSSECVPVAG